MTEDEPFVVEALMLVPRVPTARTDGGLLRRAADAIGTVNGKPFSGSSPRARSFLEGQTAAARISLIHPDFGEESGYENAWVSLGVMPDAKLDLDVLMLSMHLGNPQNRIECQWKLARDLVSRLIVVIKPSVTGMNGRRVDIESAVLPSEKALARGFPDEMTPFFYLGARYLTVERREALSRLPAFQTQPCGDGWMLALVESLSERPDEALLNHIGAIAGHAVSYLAPVLP